MKTPKKTRRFLGGVLTRLLEVCVPFGEVLKRCELGYFQLTDRVLRLPWVFRKETGLPFKTESFFGDTDSLSRRSVER